MIPITQDRVGSMHGNCYAACIASIYEIPLESLPKVPEDASVVIAKYQTENNAMYWTEQNYFDAWWHDMWDEWFEANNIQRFKFDYPTHSSQRPKGYGILTGTSPRKNSEGKNLTHAVVYHDGLLEHDPHPDRSGLLSMDSITLFYPKEPTKPILQGNA
jgi:hypothetical protein